MACGGGAGRWAALGAAYLADPVGRGVRPGGCLWRLPFSVGSGRPRRGREPSLSQEAGGPGVAMLGGKGGFGTARGRSCGPASRSPGRTSGPPPPSVRPDWLVQGLQGSSEPSCFRIFKLCFRAVWRKMLALASGAGSSRPPATPARSVMRALGESPAGLRALQTGSGRRGHLRPVVRRLLRGPRGSGASVYHPRPGGRAQSATFVNRALAGFGAGRAPGRDPPGPLPFVGGQSGLRPIPAQPGCFYQDSDLRVCLQAEHPPLYFISSFLVGIGGRCSYVNDTFSFAPWVSY